MYCQQCGAQDQEHYQDYCKRRAMPRPHGALGLINPVYKVKLQEGTWVCCFCQNKNIQLNHDAVTGKSLKTFD